MISVSMLGLKDRMWELDELNMSDADFIHLDVMDGIFVDDSYLIEEGDASKITKPLDVHLMVKDPTNYIGYVSKYRPKYITIHAEIPNASLYLDVIRNKGIGAGVAISPTTKLDVLEPLLSHADLVLVMTVEPGKGGQNFLYNSLSRIRKVKNMAKEVNPDIIIEVDGGINSKNIGSCRDAGADMFAVGSYVTSSTAFNEAIMDLKKIINK